MQEKQFYSLLKNYRSGKASQEEIQLLNAYYELFENNPDGLSEKSPKASADLQSQIEFALEQKMDAFADSGKNRPSSFRILWVAAAVACLFCVSAIIYFIKREPSPLIEKFSRYNIVPGKSKVMLTLSDGRKIAISQSRVGIISTQGNSKITRSQAGALVYESGPGDESSTNSYNTISVPEALSFEVILPDKSKVFLNAGSSLRYPTDFTASKRIVELKGEAYFEVSHNKQKPFVVKTLNQDVEVLGTHFNISAYQDEQMTKTTLLEGSVKVSATSETVILQPGQQSQLSVTSKSTYLEKLPAADTSQAVAWKNGYFQYHEATIKTIMRDLSKWYGVRVTFQGDIQERSFSGSIHRNLGLLQTLDLLNYTQVHFTIKDKEITITNN